MKKTVALLTLIVMLFCVSTACSNPNSGSAPQETTATPQEIENDLQQRGFSTFMIDKSTPENQEEFDSFAEELYLEVYVSLVDCFIYFEDENKERSDSVYIICHEKENARTIEEYLKMAVATDGYDLEGYYVARDKNIVFCGSQECWQSLQKKA